MRQYTQREFIKICMANGFYYDRHNGDHAIYVNDKGRHISIPSKLECVIARRLIKENNLEVNVNKLKRNKRMGLLSDNLPAGSENDPRAPWNEPLDIDHKRFVSASISFYHNVSGPPDMTEEQIREAIDNWIKSWKEPREFDVDELVVLDE